MSRLAVSRNNTQAIVSVTSVRLLRNQVSRKYIVLAHGRRNRGAGGGAIFWQPKKFKIIKTTTYRSVYRYMAKIC